MLTINDLATVRAALQFLDEEFSPQEDGLFQHYLDDEGVLAGASTEHIQATRAKFDSAKLYMALKQVNRNELVSSNLTLATTADEIFHQVGLELPVAVIVINS